MATESTLKEAIVKMRLEIREQFHHKFTQYQLKMSVRLKRRVNQDEVMEEILEKLKV